MSDEIRECRASCQHNMNGKCIKDEGIVISILGMCSAISPKESRNLKGKFKE